MSVFGKNGQTQTMKTLALLCCIMLLPWVAMAQEVTVQVQTKGESALMARANGLREAESAALLKLLQGIYPEKANEVASRVGSENAGQLVKNFEVLREKSTAHEYAAEIRYIFDREKVDRLIAQERGLAPQIDSTALLILPVWQEDNALLLWEPENHWRFVMSTIAMQEGRGKLVMPFGDPRDAFIIDHETLLAGDRKAMVELAERYGVRNVVIAQARNVAKENAPPEIEVLLRRPGLKSKEEITTVRFKAEPATQTQAQVLERAAQEIARRLAEATTHYSLFADEDAEKVKARVVRAEFRHNREWMQLKRAFDGLSGVEYIDIGAISPRFAQVTFYFRGSDAMIRRALMTRGIEVRDANGYWLLSLPH